MSSRESIDLSALVAEHPTLRQTIPASWREYFGAALDAGQPLRLYHPSRFADKMTRAWVLACFELAGKKVDDPDPDVMRQAREIAARLV